MSSDPHSLDELKARLDLASGAATLLAGLCADDGVLERTQTILAEILRAMPLDVADLGICRYEAGPAQWAADTTRIKAGVYLMAIKPFSKLEAGVFARRLNAEREHLRRLGGPVLLIFSQATDEVLRNEAPDFHTWIAQSYVLPSPGELEAIAPKLGVVSLPKKPEAPPEDPIRFLHISDLHLRPGRVKRYDQDRVLKGLLDFLERDRESFPLDLILVTGDLAQSGKAEEYALVSEFLSMLMKNSSVPTEHVFVVPGNHDIDRDIGRWLLRSLGSDKDSIEFFTDKQNRRFHEQKLGAYLASMRGLLGEHRALGVGVGAGAVEMVHLKGHALAIASFHSAWFAQGDDDEGQLWLGEPNIKEALDAIAEKKADFAIALMHHPFEHLSEVERDTVESWCERGFDLVVRGHLHKSKPRSLATQRGGFVELAGPAGYQGSQWGNGCFLGEIRAKAGSIRLRPYKYASGPDPWVLNTEVFPDDEKDNYCRTFEVPVKIRTKSSRIKAGGVGAGESGKTLTEEEKRELLGRAQAQFEKAERLERIGQWDEALRLWKEELLPLYERLGDTRGRAATMHNISLIAIHRGQDDDATRILREDVLIAHERLGDAQGRAAAMNNIAHILYKKGRFEEALRILREDVLPTLERLGDKLTQAVALGTIAEILREQGKLDEALRILQQNVLPVLERFQAHRWTPEFKGDIARILQRQHRLDEACNLLRREVLPILANLMDAYLLTNYRKLLADILIQRGHPEDRPEAAQLLELALKDALIMRIPLAEEIRTLQQKLASTAPS